MEDMKWTKDLATGVEVLDKQHNHYMSVCEKAYKSAKTGGGVVNALKNTYKAAEEHFVTEEAMMEKLRYPDMEGHKRLHDKFLEMELMIAKEAASGMDSKKLAVKIKEELFDWFVLHIKKNDLKLVKNLDMKKIK
ncbi:MAG: hypothetical protein CVV21_02155 [Candidatus Goldiibacteriota bacterium HGW-Goldbacteria-1]|jgi:hemerythrin|nr:MAG: hypothetical protein CVV21_02155 [Candidatus Goldiibacteriota bacterium HGW-Goldbacteria-1]